MPFIDDLNENTPLGGQAVSTGAPAIREIKATLLDSFPFLDAAVSEVATDVLKAADEAAIRTVLELGEAAVLDASDAIGDVVVLIDDGDTNPIIDYALLGLPDIAAASDIRTASGDEILTIGPVFEAAGLVALGTGSGEFNPNMATGINFARTLNGSSTLGNPTNPTVGKSGVFVITASGATRTLAKGSNWKSSTGITWPISIPSGQSAFISYWTYTTSFIWIAAVDLNPA